MSEEPDVKLIKHTGECDRPDDPSYPWKLEASMSPPQFMTVAFIGIHGGSEDIVARGKTKEALEAWYKEKLGDHPRMRRATLTGPDGVTIDLRAKPTSSPGQ